MLTRDWFKPENAGNLRRYLRQLILELFIEQASSDTEEPVLQAIVEKQELVQQAHANKCVRLSFPLIQFIVTCQ